MNLEQLQNDGLPCPSVGPWAESKHRLVGLYASLFSTGMKDKWSQRVYVDLYSGAGYSLVRGTGRVIPGSPLIAATVTHPFDKYVFCDETPDHVKALKTRIARHAPGVQAAYIVGNCNERIEEILAEMPKASKSNTVLTLCFVDPFDIGLQFETLRTLSGGFVDFLVLLAIHMDANRNIANYIKDNSKKLDDMLGNSDWRQRWRVAEAERKPFPKFLAEEFSKSLEGLRYLRQPFHRMKLIRRDDNVPLYHLALFSRSQRAYEFWDQVLKYSDDQIPMFE